MIQSVLFEKIRRPLVYFLTSAFLFTFQFFYPVRLDAGTKLTLLLTSNLKADFFNDAENRGETDPMLLLGQSIIREKNGQGFDIYLDLGNAFYSGMLSRYSYGSVMMDFFSFFDCSATLISSRDISMGLSNLEFLSRGRKTRMLSANIVREKQPVFTPYIEVSHDGKKIGIIGVSSSDGLFDIADKKVLNISFSEYSESIRDMAGKLKKDGCDNLILLSGLSYRKNMELMMQIPEVDLVISGGDSSGNLFSIQSSRVDLQWGRSIVSLAEEGGYYKLELDLSDRITVSSMNFSRLSEYKTSDPLYREFSNRLSLWKDKFREEEKNLIADNIPAVSIRDETAANLLRYRYRSEIGIVEKFSITPLDLEGPLYNSAIMNMVKNDYPVFRYSLKGSELKKAADSGGELVIAGLINGKVQGYAVSDRQSYSICSTQVAYDRITRLLRKHIDYTNTWKTLQDEIEDDLKTEKKITSPDFDYLEDRFGILCDINLSNFYDKSVVEKGENISTPPGKPTETYRRWGMEDRANITIYNYSHHLLLTPYIYYIRQNEKYLQNLLRGTLVYTYSPNSYFKPYHKSQFDTVLVNVEGRPVLVRETAGVSLKTDNITGRFGAGFEKQVKDPVNPSLYGIETLLDLNIPFADEFLYSFKLDSFISLRSKRSDELKARTEISNSVSYRFNSIIGISMKYKWFHHYTKELEESYKYSQILFSLDLKTDFKLF